MLATGWGSGFPPPVQHAGGQEKADEVSRRPGLVPQFTTTRSQATLHLRLRRQSLLWCPPMCWHHRGCRTRTAGAFGVAPHRLQASMAKQFGITSAPRNSTEHYTWVDSLLKLWVCQSLHTSLPPGSFWSHLTKKYVRHLGLVFRF